MYILREILENLVLYRDEIITLFLIVVLPLCLLAGSVYGFNRFKCRQTAIIVGTDYRFSLVSGCFLRDKNNQWLERRVFLLAQALPIKNSKQF